MRLSFVIPAYNEEVSLGACIESILAQTAGIESQTEIIVVNNASTDRTREVALAYPTVKLVDEPRKGLPQARQGGFNASSGSLIANVDADSRLTPGWVGKVLAAFEASPRMVALSGPVIFYGLTRRESVLDLLPLGVGRVCLEPLCLARWLHGAGGQLHHYAGCA
jgi:glycosyltransferase involved in cell wall biosynthesis